MPGFIEEHPEWSADLRTMARTSRTPILFGTLDLEWHGPGDYDYYNAAMLVDSMGVLNAQPPYRKSYLVPIVERVPFVNPRWFKGLKYFGGYGRGQNTKPFVVSFGKVGVLICYESIFPQRSREFRREGANLIVNITNDAWFGKSLAPYQHEAHMALRAIENRVGIVRAANTGISAYIDPLGRIQGETQLDVADSRVYDAQTTNVTTLYVRHRRLAGLTRAAGDHHRTASGALPAHRGVTERSVGIDVGGTFTDLVSVAEDGSVEARKRLTTVRDQSEGVIDALRALGAEPSAVTRFVHGTTVGDQHAARAHRRARRAVCDPRRQRSARASPPGARVALRSHAPPSRATRAAGMDDRRKRTRDAPSRGEGTERRRDRECGDRGARRRARSRGDLAPAFVPRRLARARARLRFARGGH